MDGLNVGTLYAMMKLDASEFNAGLTNVADGVTRIGDLLTAKFVSDAVFNGLREIAGGLGQIVDIGSRFNDLAERVGISAEAVQQLDFAAKQTGTTFETVATSIRVMSDRLVDGDLPEILSQMGLSIEALRNMAPDEAFIAMADAIGRIPDPMLQSATAVDVFGRGAQQMLPMIRAGILELAEAAPTMSNAMVTSLDESGDKWLELQTRLTNLRAEALMPLIDAFNGLPQSMQVGIAGIGSFLPSIEALTLGVIALGGPGAALATLGAGAAIVGGTLATMAIPIGVAVAAVAALTAAWYGLTTAWSLWNDSTTPELPPPPKELTAEFWAASASADLLRHATENADMALGNFGSNVIITTPKIADLRVETDAAAIAAKQAAEMWKEWNKEVNTGSANLRYEMAEIGATASLIVAPSIQNMNASFTEAGGSVANLIPSTNNLTAALMGLPIQPLNQDIAQSVYGMLTWQQSIYAVANGFLALGSVIPGTTGSVMTFIGNSLNGFNTLLSSIKSIPGSISQISSGFSAMTSGGGIMSGLSGIMSGIGGIAGAVGAALPLVMALGSAIKRAFTSEETELVNPNRDLFTTQFIGKYTDPFEAIGNSTIEAAMKVYGVDWDTAWNQYAEPLIRQMQDADTYAEFRNAQLAMGELFRQAGVTLQIFDEAGNSIAYKSGVFDTGVVGGNYGTAPTGGYTFPTGGTTFDPAATDNALKAFFGALAQTDASAELVNAMTAAAEALRGTNSASGLSTITNQLTSLAKDGLTNDEAQTVLASLMKLVASATKDATLSGGAMPGTGGATYGGTTFQTGSMPGMAGGGFCINIENAYFSGSPSDAKSFFDALYQYVTGGGDALAKWRDINCAAAT
jgi:hypothetical protein